MSYRNSHRHLAVLLLFISACAAMASAEDFSSINLWNSGHDGYATFAPVGSFKPNAFGVYDTAGNVTQWVEDRWNSTYDGAPRDGSAWETGDQLRRVMRSGSWYNNSGDQEASFRNADSPRVHNQKIGFRVAVTL